MAQSNQKSLRRYYICCSMYIEQKDFTGLCNHILMNGKNYQFYKLVQFLVIKRKFVELLEYFNEQIEELTKTI